MRFAAVIRHEQTPMPSPQAVDQAVPDEITRGTQPIAPQPQEVPADLDQRVRLAGEW
jgi:hypothetical protein